jgi:hypothetical protein
MLSRGGISLEGKNVIILGSGGTSKTARCAAGKLGAKKISVVSRRGEISYDNVYDLADTQIVINTTPLGMYPKNGECAVDISRFPHLEGVADVVYNPLKTKLMLDAEKLGIRNVGGIYMLVAQAHAAAERFLDKKLPEELIEKAHREGRVYGFVSNSGDRSTCVQLRNVNLNFAYSDARKAAAGGLVLELGDYEFVVLACNCSMSFTPADTCPDYLDLLSKEEGVFENSVWKRGRIMNGDEQYMNTFPQQATMYKFKLCPYNFK